MPPKRKAPAAATSTAPKRTRLAAETEDEGDTIAVASSAPSDPASTRPTPAAAKTTAKKPATTKRSTPLAEIAPPPATTRTTRNGKSAASEAPPPKPAKKEKDIFDVPSSSDSEEEPAPVKKPAPRTRAKPVMKASTTAVKASTTTTAKATATPAASVATPVRPRAKRAPAAAVPETSDTVRKTPAPKRGAKKAAVVPAVTTTQEIDESASTTMGETPRPRVKKAAAEKEGVTPKTAAKPSAPPKTAKKKSTSAVPKTKVQAKLGVGVPAGGEEMTPTARRTGPVKEVEEEATTGAGVDEDEDVVTKDGKVVPASAVAKSASKRRPSAGRPSLGTEGLVDPFAVPSRVDGAEESVLAKRSVGPPPKKVAPKATANVSKALADTPAEELENLSKDIRVSEDDIAAVKHHILGKIMGRERLTNLVGLDEEYTHVHQLLEQTVAAGEGNSMLIIGARGSGKTTLVETALESLTESHSGEFHVVRLNGLLQTDDKLALREIWRQLGVEMELEDSDQAKPTNFADTLQSILAVLSHPDEILAQAGEVEEAQEDPTRTATAVVFILDEFDHFVTHPRQTLLYNLFDIAQAKKAPIAVLGLTCKVDVVDSLEKRVKSRFSHRTVHLKLPSSLDDFWQIVKEGLSVDTIKVHQAQGYSAVWNDEYLEVAYPPIPSPIYMLTTTP
jgi:origin recognition complex subunit 4